MNMMGSWSYGTVPESVLVHQITAKVDIEQ